MEMPRSAAEVANDRLERVLKLMGSHHIHYGPDAVPFDVSIEPMEDTYGNGSVFHLKVQRPPRQRNYPDSIVFSACIKADGTLGGSSSGSGNKAMDVLFVWPRRPEQNVDDLLEYIGQPGSSLSDNCQHGPTTEQAFNDLTFLRSWCTAILGPDEQRQTDMIAAIDGFERRANAA